MNNITLRQLAVFRAVAQHENLGKAAATLFITKGAVSQSLQELERLLDIQLFDRVHPRLYLNHEGQRLLPLADEILQRANDIELTFSDKRHDHFLSVGCSKTIGNYLLPELLHHFEQAGDWLPDIHIANSRRLCDLIETFQLDVALLEGEERYSGLVFEPWLLDEMVVVGHKEHPLAGRSAHALPALRKERWIVREPASGSRDYFMHNLAPLIGMPEPVLTMSSPEAIMGAVSQGIGVTFTSRRIVEGSLYNEQLKVIPLKKRFPRTFSICYHKKKYHSVSMRHFLEFCRNWKRLHETEEQ